MRNLVFGMILVAGLSACGEKPQTLESNKHDSAAFTGTGKAYVLKDWKVGDKTSWESQLKARGQYGQNDYTRMN
jgi:hypothetical protein